MKITIRCKHLLCGLLSEHDVPVTEDGWEGELECPECGLDNYVEIEVRGTVTANAPEAR